MSSKYLEGSCKGNRTGGGYGTAKASMTPGHLSPPEYIPCCSSASYRRRGNVQKAPPHSADRGLKQGRVEVTWDELHDAGLPLPKAAKGAVSRPPHSPRSRSSRRRHSHRHTVGSGARTKPRWEHDVNSNVKRERSSPWSSS